MRRQRWSDDDRRRFAERNFLRAWSIPKRRRPAPQPDEWEIEDEEDET